MNVSRNNPESTKTTIPESTIRAVVSVSGVIIGRSFFTTLFCYFLPSIFPFIISTKIAEHLGLIIGSILGGWLGWKYFGDYIINNPNDKLIIKSAQAPGFDWGTIVFATIGSTCGRLLFTSSNLIPYAQYLGAAIFAPFGLIIGGLCSRLTATKIKHKTSKLVTNIATALGATIGSSIGLFVNPMIGAAIGAPVGGALGGLISFTFFKNKDYKEKLVKPRTMLVAGGIVGAVTGISIGSVISVAYGFGSEISQAIGGVTGSIIVGTISYKVTNKVTKNEISTFEAGSIGSILGAAIGFTFGSLLPFTWTVICTLIGGVSGVKLGLSLNQLTLSQESIVQSITSSIGLGATFGEAGRGLGGLTGLLMSNIITMNAGRRIGNALGIIFGITLATLYHTLLSSAKATLHTLLSSANKDGLIILYQECLCSIKEWLNNSLTPGKRKAALASDNLTNNSMNPTSAFVFVKENGANSSFIGTIRNKNLGREVIAVNPTPNSIEQKIDL